MKKLFKNIFFVQGNILYLLFFIGFLFYTDPNPVIFHKYTIVYVKGLLILLLFLIPYNVLLFILIHNSLKLTINKKVIFLRLPYRIALVSFLVLVFFLSTELFLRMYPKPKGEDFHPFLQAMNTKENGSAWHVNSEGFRYDEISKNKPKNTYRIFITGGSTVFDEWQPYEKTLVKQVEDLLREHYPDQNIQVINAGYLRYTSEHTLILYQTKLADYHPDLIIVWQGFNDLYYSCTPPYLSSGRYKSDYSHFYAVMANVVNNYFNFKPHLYTIDLLNKVFSQKFYADFKPYVSIPGPRPLENKPDTWKFPSIEAYTRNMNYLVKAIKSDNIAVLMGNQANMYNKKNKDSFGLIRTFCTYDGKYPSNESVIHAMKQLNESSRKIAEENKIPFVDIASKVPQTHDYMYDDVHYTLKGDTFIANILYKSIVENRFLENLSVEKPF